MMGINKLWQLFNKRFKDTGLQKGVYSAPGRVNLIGEHTDYNEGYVLPMAIEKEIIILAQLRKDKKVCVYSLDYKTEDNFSFNKINLVKENTWLNYIMGVANEIKKRKNIKGMNILFTGNIPQGSGLSSSAALEIVTALTIVDLNSISIDPVEMALLCQQAENDFVGVACGIMDQYISRLGKEGYVLLIDCRTNRYKLIPFNNKDYKIVICNSKVQRGLVDSEYNKRRKECNRAVKLLNKKLKSDIKSLRDVSYGELNKFLTFLPEVTYKRAKHVITENERVLAVVRALKNNDINEVGRLMIKSHYSLKNDYEVSCKELDLLVELALTLDGVIGARMTGAGFGGCTVNLVRKNIIDKFKDTINYNYEKETGIKPEIYVSNPSNGAGVAKNTG